MSAHDEPIRLLIVDDDPLVRSALRRMLAETADISVVAEADDGDGVLAQVEAHRPDVVLMDLRMPRVDGVRATSLVRRQRRPPAVLVLTTFESDDDIRAALRAGAAGYLVKDSPPEAVEAAVREVRAGRPALSPSVTRRLIDAVTGGAEPERAPADRPPTEAQAGGLGSLTGQERAVARGVAQGHSNAQIARHLHLSLSTVKAYTSNAMAKLGLENRTQLALYVHDRRADDHRE